MKRLFILAFLLCIYSGIHSQPFAVGSRQLSFTDASRSRTIATRVYHPATSAGSNKPFVTGAFPLIILGHGFSMSYDAYLNFADSLVPLGYIVVMPTTEVGPIPFPNHEDFALDLRFLNSEIKSQNSLSTSIFYQHVTNESAIMGHSMGGGCTFLACENNSDVTTMVVFAPAETNTSAIAAASGVTIPALVFSGENDGVTLPADNHIPMYNNLSSSCKTFVNIIGGGHCYYALTNWACDFGESTSSPQPTITRTEQQIPVFNLLIPYLDGILKNSLAASDTFISRLQSRTDISYQRDCISSNPVRFLEETIISPNPCPEVLFVADEIEPPFTYIITDISGRNIKNGISQLNFISVGDLYPGTYIINLENSNGRIHRKFMKE